MLYKTIYGEVVNLAGAEGVRLKFYQDISLIVWPLNTTRTIEMTSKITGARYTVEVSRTNMTRTIDPEAPGSSIFRVIGSPRLHPQDLRH